MNAEDVKNILTTIVVNVNAIAMPFESFLNCAVHNLFNSDKGEVSQKLEIIDDLLGAGADDILPAQTIGKKKARELFAQAIASKKYNAASLILSIVPTLMIEPKEFNQIITQGSTELVLQVCKRFYRDKRAWLNNTFWPIIVARSDAEEIIEKFIEVHILPDDIDSQAKVLFLGIKKQNEGIVRALARPELMTKYNKGLSPLHVALWKGEEDATIVDILLAAGADPHLKGRSGVPLTSLELACSFGWTGLIAKFIRSRDDLLDPNSGQSSAPISSYAIYTAVNSGEKKSIKTLCDLAVEYGIENYLDLTGCRGLIMLNAATINKNEGIVDYLISLGADVNAKNAANISPLAMAMLAGTETIVNSLVSAGAKIDKEEADYIASEERPNPTTSPSRGYSQAAAAPEVDQSRS